MKLRALVGDVANKAAIGALLCATLTILLLVPVALQAQGSTADVLGTVTDPSGAVVADAKVTARNTGTGISRSVQTSKSGEYVVNALQIGSYEVVIEAKGFKTSVTRDLTLAAGDRTRVDAKLALGQTSESVEVSAAVVGLQTDTSTVGTLIGEQAVQDLPLNGRNLINLVQLAAGVTPGVQNSISNGSRDADRRQTNAFSVNGQYDIYNSNLIDGMDNNERFIGTIGVKPSVDAVQEVRVSTNLYSAEYSRSVGGVVDVITKSGSNQLHGSLFEFLRNDVVDARDYFAFVSSGINKNKLRQNQFGGSIGGPIRKDKTFFFGDYEGFRQISGYNVAHNTVPTAAQQQELAAGQDVTINGVLIPATNIAPIGKKLFQLYPLPNCLSEACGAGNYVSDPARTQFSHTFDVRIDHHFSDKDSLFGRFSYNRVKTLVPGAFPAVSADGQTFNPGGSISSGPASTGDSSETADHLGLDYVHIFRPNLLLELKAAYMRFNNTNLTLNGLDAANKFGFVCSTTDCVNAPFGGGQYGLPGIGYSRGYPVAAIGDGAFTPLFDINNTFIYSGALTWTRGAHSVKAGLSLIRRQVARQQSFNARGDISFDGSFTGDALGDMLEGMAAGVARDQMLVYPHYRFWEPGGYIKDDWRVKKWLTLNLGLRYDIFTPFTEVNGYISNFDPVSGLIVSPDLVGANHSSKTAGVKTDFKNIAPRVGLAASLSHGMVVRGGFGMTYFPTAQGPNSALNNAPFSFGIRCSRGGPSPCPNADEAGYIDLTQNSVPIPVYDITRATVTDNYRGVQLVGIDPNFKSTYLYQYSLQVEKELGANIVSVGYVGNVGRQLPSVPNLQSIVSATLDTTLPYPNLPPDFIASMWQSTARSRYDAMQVSFRRRFRAGLTANANWTWSHTLNNSQVPVEGPGGGFPNCNLACYEDVPGGQPKFIKDGYKTYDWGNGDEDVRHRVTVMLNYQLPFAKSWTGVAGGFAKGWSVNSAVAWQTGLPISITAPQGPPGTAGNSGQLGPHGDRPDQVGNPLVAGTVAANSECSAPDRIHTIAAWFNTCAFVPNPVGLNGNTARNSLYGPHAFHWDFSVGKEIPIRERLKLQFRAEVFNLTNTPNFGLPSSGMGGGPPGLAAFGQIGSTAVGSNPRQMQFALRLTF